MTHFFIALNALFDWNSNNILIYTHQFHCVSIVSTIFKMRVPMMTPAVYPHRYTKPRDAF